MRRRRSEGPRHSYDAAETNINTMERAVVRVMATPEELVPDDVLEWLVAPEPLQQLRAAFPYAHSFNYSGTSKIDFPFAKTTFVLDYGKLCCVPPKDGMMKLHFDAPKHEELWLWIEDVNTIVKQHDKLRTIVRWLTANNVTPGAARNCFPALQSLLPPDHPFHKVTGDRYKPIAIPLDIAELLREAPEIVAQGLLINPKVNGVYTDSVVKIDIDGGQYLALFPVKK
jgi:hypothetical protein